MATTLLLTAKFGSGYTGLATVGFQLYGNDKVAVGSRVTAGVTEDTHVLGCYYCPVSVADGWSGYYIADTGGTAPVYAGPADCGAAVAKSPATLDWSADVTNKPTIGTSTLDAAGVRTAIGMSEANLDEQLGDMPEALAAEIFGSGSVTVPIECQIGGVALDGVEVKITLDAAGTQIVAGPWTTNASGVVTFYLEPPGDYYVWRQRSGCNFTNPTTLEYDPVAEAYEEG
jgi:hypothetical protein